MLGGRNNDTALGKTSVGLAEEAPFRLTPKNPTDEPTARGLEPTDQRGRELLARRGKSQCPLIRHMGMIFEG